MPVFCDRLRHCYSQSQAYETTALCRTIVITPYAYYQNQTGVRQTPLDTFFDV